jgi:parallel beta-helix repeat protein
MGADLGPCTQHGLYVKSGVTLDCRGRTVVGVGSRSKDFGIYLAGATGATVRNCEVTGFHRGIRLRDAHRNRIIGNHAHHNGDLIQHAGYGIDVAGGSTDNLFQENLVHDSADEGIHVGTGGHGNSFIGNKSYDNFRENIYLLRSDRGLYRGNTTWGGRANSLFVKHSSFNRFENNTLRDRPVLLRGESHDNQFIANEFINAGIHFQLFEEAGKVTRPTANLVTGGTIGRVEKCIRFSGASGNRIKDVVLNQCVLAVESTGANSRAENTFTGVTFNPKEISLDQNSLIRVGWRLDVSVKDGKGAAVTGAKVQGFDLHKNLIFEAVTDAKGVIPTQEVIEYVQSASTRVFNTPHQFHVTTGEATAVREVTVDGSQTLTITVQGANP